MKTFVTGANGLIGSPVVRAAVVAGHEVIGLVRSTSAASAVAAAGATPIFGDLAEPVRFLDAVASCVAVVHTAVGQRGQVTETDHRAVAAMLEVLADRSATFILTSGLGVYAGSPTRRFQHRLDLGCADLR